MASQFGRKVVAYKVNKSGGSVAAGDVVVPDTTNDNAFTTTTSAAVTTGVWVADEAIASNATGRVVISGHVTLINVSASVTRGHTGTTHTVAKQAVSTGGTTRTAGTFCKFTTGGTTPEADIWPVDLGAGSGLSDPMTTRGDIIVRDSSNVTARLAIGATAGMVVGKTGSDVAYFLPPGYEYSYVEYPDLVTSHTSEGTADAVVVSASIALDGSTAVFVEFFSPRVIIATTAGALLVLDLYVDSTIQGRIAVIINPASAGFNLPVFLKSPKITPSNASHTFTVKAWHGTGAATVSGGAGGTGNNVKGFIRVVKA